MFHVEHYFDELMTVPEARVFHLEQMRRRSIPCAQLFHVERFWRETVVKFAVEQEPNSSSRFAHS